MEHVRCNLCGSAEQTLAYRMPDTRYARDTWYNVVRCDRCGLGFVNPRPALQEMANYYPREFYEFFQQDPGYQSRRYRREAAMVCGAGVRSGRLLDIGCAGGGFPAFMADAGWQAEGVEIGPAAAPRTDLPIHRTPFPDLPETTSPFDVITAWAVLEHVHDPMAHFEKASHLLRPGGLFVFLVTNFDSLASRRLFQEDVPRHLYFFTEPTIKRYLERTGFVLRRAEYSNAIYPMHPVHWSRYLRSRLTRHPWSFESIPPNRIEYHQQRGRKPGVLANVRYALENPLTIADRVLAPWLGKLEMWTRRYGIVTYTAVRL